MTPLQQQRLIGIILLLIIISSIALFLLNKVSINNPVEDSSDPEIFDSVVEPIISQDDGVIEPVEEVQVIVAEPEIVTPPAPLIEAPLPPTVQKAAAAVEKPKPVALTPIEPVPNNVDSAPQWYIQVGSFSVKENATQLSQRLESQGLSPVIKSSMSNGKAIYRVQLPPTTDKSSLNKTSEQLARTLNLAPRILQLQ